MNIINRIDKSIFLIILLLFSYSANSTVDILKVAYPAPAISSADPFARDEGGGIRFALYDALTWLDPEGKLTPALAVSWENITPTKWQFNLRQNIKFSNGEDFKSSSVIFTLSELFSDEVFHPRKADINTIKSFRELNEYSLEIETHKPDPLLPRRLALLPIIESDSWSSIGQREYSRSPVGTGPYLIESWGANNTRPVLVYNKESWRKVKQMKRIEINVIPEPASRVSALLSQEIDLAVGLPSDDIETLRANGMKVRILSSPNILSIALRTVRDEDTPLKDARVRKALNYAVDKQSIVDLILNGTTRVAHQPSSPGLIGYNPEAEPFDYNPDKAIRLLRDSGYAQGFDLKFSVYGGLLPSDTLIFQKVAQDLNKIKVKTELRQISFPDYVRKVFSGNWGDVDGFSIGWMNNILWDPQRSYEQFSCGYSAPFYCDELIMPQIAEARTEMDPQKREELLKAIVLRLRDQGAALWLVEFSGILAFREGINLGKIQLRLDGSLYERVTYRLE